MIIVCINRHIDLLCCVFVNCLLNEFVLLCEGVVVCECCILVGETVHCLPEYVCVVSVIPV